MMDLIKLCQRKCKDIEKYKQCLKYCDINLQTNKVGIFSKIVALDVPVRAGDRIEIYRPLILDPKEARRLRAEKAKQEK